LETFSELSFCRFSGPFEPLFDSFCGVNIRSLILTPQKEVENRLKRARKSTETESINSLLGQVLRGCALQGELLEILIALERGGNRPSFGFGD